MNTTKFVRRRSTYIVLPKLKETWWSMLKLSSDEFLMHVLDKNSIAISERSSMHVH